jgi:nucleoid DNA-binding protein
MAKSKKKAAAKFSLINEIHAKTLTIATTTRNGEVRIKRADLKKIIEDTMTEGALRAAAGERIRFPVIGALVAKPVAARKAGKGTNPFTGEPMTIKARPESRKPRWSFPKTLKETFSNKKNW